jgi:hypothetical protein
MNKKHSLKVSENLNSTNKLNALKTILDNLTDPEMIKKFVVLYGTQFIIAFTSPSKDLILRHVHPVDTFTTIHFNIIRIYA